MADVLTIYEKFKSLKGLNVVFIGDGNNVAVSLMHACAKLGMNFSIASPEGYDMPVDAWKSAQAMAKESGCQLSTFRDPIEAVKGKDVIYTDTWVSMGQEEEAEKRKKVFPPFQVNSSLVAHANKDVIVMHCLPAHRGHELTDEVADGPHSMIFPQAHNRLHAQKAILVKLLA
jgi:ornithine carbamoyltransferase